MGACELLLSVVEGLSGLGQVDHHHHDELMIMMIMMIMRIMRIVMIILTDDMSTLARWIIIMIMMGNNDDVGALDNIHQH